MRQTAGESGKAREVAFADDSTHGNRRSTASRLGRQDCPASPSPNSEADVRHVFMVAMVCAALFALFSCNNESRTSDAGDAGDSASSDSGNPHDAGAIDSGEHPECGTNNIYSEFNHHCYGKAGCTTSADIPTCGCTCTACQDTTCTKIECGTGCPDGGGRDAGDAPDAFGSGYFRVATKARALLSDGYVAWYTEPKYQTPDGEVGSDVCYYNISKGQTKCLGLDSKMARLEFLAINGTKLCWTMGKGSLNILSYYNTDTGDIAEIENNPYPYLNCVIYGNVLIFSRMIVSNTNILRQVFFVYDLLTGSTKQHETQKSPVLYSLYIWGNDVVYLSVDNSNTKNYHVYHLDLVTGMTKLLESSTAQQNFCCSMYNQRFVWMDWVDNSHDGPAVVMYDLGTNIKTTLASNEYGQWFPTINKNHVVWTDNTATQSAEGAGNIMIMDVSTGRKRQITNEPKMYGGEIYGKYLLATDGLGALYSDYYLADLEKLGIIDANGGLITQ